MMNRRADVSGATGRAGKDRRTTLLRLGTILALVLMAAAAIVPRLVSADNPYSTTSPRSDVGNNIQGIYKLIFWLALVVFVGVQAGIVYTVLRYRRRHDDDERPEQVHGNKTLEIVWTILPAIVLLVIFIPSVREMYDQHAAAEDGDVIIEVYGKQWWWEVHYTKPEETVGVVTANEIYVPQGAEVLLKLYSNNVIHSFWVSQLAGKMDLMPGHENRLAFTATDTGYYWGQCAEYCGDSHANMQFKVVVVPQAEFDKYINGWKAGPTQASAEVAGSPDNVAAAPAALGACLACHRINGAEINGNPMNVAAEGLEQPAGTYDAPGTAKTAGPNLSLFGCRTMIGAGILDNTPENLAKWLHDPAGVKPGNWMGTGIKKGTLSDEAIAEIVGYLESLKPEGGCPVITGEQLPENVASPEANNAAVQQAMTDATNLQATAAAVTATAQANASATAAAEASAAALQPTPAPQEGGQGGEGGGAPALPTTIDLAMQDIHFDKTELTIPANTDVTLNLVNQGAGPHDFTIDGHPEATSELYNPGQTGTLTLNLPPGEYEYYCSVPGHKEAGMHGILKVVEGGGAAPAGGEQPAAQGGEQPAPAEGGATAIDLKMQDIHFDKTELSIPANTDVTLNLVNEGAGPHDFTIDGHPEASSELYNPGQTGTLTLNLPPGTYEYYCSVPGHKEAGMHGTLTVT
jgi:cytochrome c oxidase subunit 2